ncbi:Ras GTPase tem1 [Coniosporium apollinis]|uniref:Ras GTPase tem1 n=2 Tax=Coniosporium TaxID=2810619 RepID=A0ABQ9NIT6_9PEZI|nr:Ras GTPase tem1 [Cladosporium sp. JES 115]KAJ9658539.1 Ras GTPase tem1 [Coniosporium apollinis]
MDTRQNYQNFQPFQPPDPLPQDQSMRDDSSINTITASTVQALPEVHTAYTPEPPHQSSRPHTSYSDTGFSRSYSHDSQSRDQYHPGYTQFSHSQTSTPDAVTPPPPQYGYSQNGHYGQGMPSRPSSGHTGGPQSGHDRYSHSEGNARSSAYQDPSQRSSQPAPPQPQPQQQYQQQPPPQQQKENTSVVIKVGMVGDAQIGKTSLMVKYVEGSWDEDYIQTLGVNFMEKTISIRNTEITFSIWDLGGQREFVNMLPLVCNDAVAILFMFDLTRKSTLNSVKEWYRQGRGFNRTAIPVLVGTKYDSFVGLPQAEQEEISNQIFKIVLSKAFDLRCTIPEIEHVGEPLLLYQSVG